MKLKYHDIELEAEIEAVGMDTDGVMRSLEDLSYNPYKSPASCEHEKVRAVCIFCGVPRWLALAAWGLIDLFLLILGAAVTAWFFLNW